MKSIYPFNGKDLKLFSKLYLAGWTPQAVSSHFDGQYIKLSFYNSPEKHPWMIKT